MALNAIDGMLSPEIGRAVANSGAYLNERVT